MLFFRLIEIDVLQPYDAKMSFICVAPLELIACVFIVFFEEKIFELFVLQQAFFCMCQRIYYCSFDIGESYDCLIIACSA